MNDDKTRFVTAPITVTGETPSGLEQAAIAYAARMTGCSEGQLAVRTPYIVHFTSELAARQAEGLNEAEKKARASGDPLYADITVAGWAWAAPPELREGQAGDEIPGASGPFGDRS
jgi:hypothetical protein